MAPNPDSKREPLPGYLVVCIVAGLAATEASFGTFGQTFFVEPGSGAHANWLALGSAVSVATGIMLEMQSRANEGDDAATENMRRARLHGGLGLAGGAIAGQVVGHEHSWVAGAVLGVSFASFAAVTPGAPVDWLARGRFGGLGLLALYTYLSLLPALIGTAQRMATADSALDWIERGGATLGVLVVIGSALLSARIVDAARLGGELAVAKHARWIAGSSGLLAVLCAAAKLSPLAGGTPSSWSTPGLLVALVWLTWAVLTSVSPPKT